jgi:catalase
VSKQTDRASGTVSDQLTTSAGNPIADNQNSLTAGPRGPLLLPDAIKRRQIALFAKCDPAYGAGVAKAVELDPVK